jgi:hypothetical protein
MTPPIFCAFRISKGLEPYPYDVMTSKRLGRIKQVAEEHPQTSFWIKDLDKI